MELPKESRQIPNFLQPFSDCLRFDGYPVFRFPDEIALNRMASSALDFRGMPEDSVGE
jgi:hypothetical protein